MNSEQKHLHEGEKPRSWVFSKATIAACVVSAVIAFLLFTGHQAHLFGALPYLLLLVCPLMHFFMHGKGHRHHEHENSDRGEGK